MSAFQDIFFCPLDSHIIANLQDYDFWKLCRREINCLEACGHYQEAFDLIDKSYKAHAELMTARGRHG